MGSSAPRVAVVPEGLHRGPELTATALVEPRRAAEAHDLSTGSLAGACRDSRSGPSCGLGYAEGTLDIHRRDFKVRDGRFWAWRPQLQGDGRAGCYRNAGIDRAPPQVHMIMQSRPARHVPGVGCRVRCLLPGGHHGGCVQIGVSWRRCRTQVGPRGCGRPHCGTRRGGRRRCGELPHVPHLSGGTGVLRVHRRGRLSGRISVRRHLRPSRHPVGASQSSPIRSPLNAQKRAVGDAPELTGGSNDVLST